MFEIIYAICVFVFMTHEIDAFFNTKERIYKMKRLSMRRKFSGETHDLRRTAMQGCFIILINLFYMLWVLMGIAFGDNWTMYLGFFVFSVYSMIVVTYCRKKNYYRFHFYYAKFDAAVSLVLLTILFLQHYNRI